MIRLYGKEDLDRVIEIWRAASAVATPFLSEAFLERESREIRDVWMRVADTWVYEVDGVVAGFIALIESEVGGIFVDSSAQSTGIGRALMDHALSLRRGPAARCLRGESDRPPVLPEVRLHRGVTLGLRDDRRAPDPAGLPVREKPRRGMTTPSSTSGLERRRALRPPEPGARVERPFRSPRWSGGTDGRARERLSPTRGGG